MVTLAQAHIVDLIVAALEANLWHAVHVFSIFKSDSPLLPFVVLFKRAPSAGISADVTLVYDNQAHPIEALRSLVAASQLRYTKSKTVAASKPAKVDRTMAILEVKPSDVDVDLHALHAGILAMTMDTGVAWVPEKFQIVPIAYGLCKLRVAAVLDAKRLSADDLAQELTARLPEESISSIDVLSSTPLKS
jgi:translation elongation factor EF-1beta